MHSHTNQPNLSEHFSSSRHHLGIYRCVTVSCRHLHPQSSSLPRGDQISPSFFAALASIVEQQPILRVGITGEDSSNAHWTHIPQLDLKDYVSVELVSCETVQEYEDKIAEHQGWEHDQKWQNLETRSPWRITIVRPSSNNESVSKELSGQEDVFFSFHHSLMDGTSGREFHEMLLSALSAHQNQDKDFSTELSFPEPPSLHQPLEAVVNFSLSWRFMLGILWSHFGPRVFKPKPQRVWNAKPIDFALPYKTRIKPLDFSPETLSALLDACRSHSVTLTALLHSLVLTSLAKRLSSSPAESPAFLSGTPISLRPYLTKKPNGKQASQPAPLRCLVSTCVHQFSPKTVSALRAPNADIDALIWQNALQAKKDLAAKLALTPKDDMAAMLKFISDWIEFWRSRDGKPRTESWEISNIGVLKSAETTNSPKATRMLFSNGAMVAGPPIGVDVASVAGSKLTVSLSWQDKAVDDELIDQLRSDLRGYAEKLAETGSSFV